MADPIHLLHNPRCSKSRGAKEILEERGLATSVREYLKDAPSRAELEDLMTKLGITDPREMMRTGEPAYKELGLADAGRDELLDALADHPILIERPIVVMGDRAVIARPPERLLGLIDG